MKKLVSTLAVMLLFVSLATAQKFAYVDSEYILENIPAYESAQKELDELAIKWQKEIEEKFAEIDKLYKDYQAEAPLLPEDLKKKREDEIINKEKEAKDLQKKRFGTDGDLYKKRQELVKPIQDKVYNVIEQIASDGNYAVIFDKAGSLTMLFTDPKYDKSDDVLDELGYEPGKSGSGSNNGDK